MEKNRLARKKLNPKPWVAMAAASVLCVLCFGCQHAYLANDLKRFPLGSDRISDLHNLDEVTFLVFGDSGSGDKAQNDVAAGMRQACGSDCDFALVLGDNIYSNGARSVDDGAFDKKFAKPYEPFGRFDFWLIPGNHDWHRRHSVQAEIDYTDRSDQWRMPFNYFEVPQLPDWLHLFGIDTTVFQDLAGTSNPKKKSELAKNKETQLAAAKESLCGKPGWRLLFGHAAVYSGGKHGYEHGDRAVIRSVKEGAECGIIEPCGVSVYFSGHDHHQELLYAPEKGYYQVIEGAGGRDLRKVRERKVKDGVQQKFACSEHGFLKAHATPQSLKMTFYGCGKQGQTGGCRAIYEATLTRSSDGSLSLDGKSKAPCQKGPED